MKRKIAILLSSMMVVTAMPLSAQAAQFSGVGIQNAEYAKAGDSIDPNASKYNTYNTVNDLRSRKSVLTLALKNDNTEAISGETVFNIKLENGIFNEDSLESFQYRNVVSTSETAAGTAFTYDEIMATNPSSLMDVWNTMISSATIDSSADTTMTDALQAGAYKGNGSDAVNTFISAVASGKSGSDKDNFETTASSEVSALKTAIIDELNATLVSENVSVPLPHIPYKFEIVDSTTAKVTVPNLNLTNSDAADDATDVVVKKYTADNVTLEYYKEEDGKLVPLEEGDYTNVGSSVTIAAVSATISAGTGTTVSTSTYTKNPVVAIPLGAVESTGNGAVKASVTADYTSKVVDGSATITKGEVTGSTSLVYDSNNIKSFEDYAELAPVIIKENVRDTIKKSNSTAADITFRLNGGFKFKNVATVSGSNNIITDVTVYNDATNEKMTNVTVTKLNDSTIKVSIDASELEPNRIAPIGIRVEGLDVEATNDKQYGDVELSVYGDGITTQSTVVAKRATFAYTLKTAETAKEIVAGRHYNNDNTNLSTQDNTTVKVNFSEAIQNTLVESRALDFSVPEGVKIVDVNLSDVKNFDASVQGGLTEDDFEIINNGTTLRLKRDSYAVKYGSTSNSLANFNLEFDLSVDPTFTGDIKLSVTGGGQSDVVETVIAKAVAPITVTTNTTNANIGYQNYKTADIVITETKPGMLLADKEVVLSLDAPYGTDELGFSNATFEVSGGELEINSKNFSIKNGDITLKVNKSSYKNPSTITLKNVEVGTTRSVPFGAYGLEVSGSAVINNYNETVKDDESFKLNSINANLVNQDNNSAYTVDKYVNIITETGTFDKVVNVTVGEKTIVIGDQVVDMDVAPYIQASSNSTMVPLRFVSLALGVDSDNVANADASNKIAWDQNTKTATIYYGAGLNQKIIQFQAGSNIMVVDGTSIAMDYGVKAEIVDSRMFVPFRALGQALGVTVDWDADTKTAIYNKQDTSVATTTASTTATSTESTTESTTATTSTTETTTVAESSSETTTQANA